MFLVVIDSHSNWIKVVPLTSATSLTVVQKLRTLFAQLGLPETIVSDNGTQFTSQEFQQFLKENGIVHITSSPYHPATNGLAERAVQMFKNGMKKTTEGTITDRIAKSLFNYRRTPQTTTGISPAELLM